MATAEIVAFGAVAHASAGGVLPSSERLLALLLLTGAVCWALHQRVLRLGAASLLAAAAQVLVHVAGSAGSTAAHAGHGEHLHAAAAGSASQMVLAHLLSGAATVLALVRQEQALLAVVRALSPAPALRVPVHHAPAPPATDDVASRLPEVVVAAAPRRGPPALRAFAPS